jgi:hypothetical protein
MKNLNEMLKKAKELQKKMEEVDQELSNMQIEGEAGGGLVKAVVSGKLEILSVTISPEAISSGDKEVLEDLIVVAVKDAQEKAKEIVQEKFASMGLAGGFPGLGPMN